MLNAILNKETQVVTFQPHGVLTATDFDEAIKNIHPLIKGRGSLHGVIIYAESLSKWKNLEIAKKHHQKVKKLAIVTNSKMHAFHTSISSYLAQTEIKHFKYDKIGDAREWILA